MSQLIDPEVILKDLDGLTASATSVLQQVDRAQNGIILLAGQVDTLKLQNDELRDEIAQKDLEIARLREETATAHSKVATEKEEELRVLREQVAAYQVEMAAYEDLKRSLQPFAHLLARLR